MSDRDAAELGQAILEELVVQAGLTQARAPEGETEVRLTLNFVVRADAELRALHVQCERVGQTPLEIRLDLA